MCFFKRVIRPHTVEWLGLTSQKQPSQEQEEWHSQQREEQMQRLLCWEGGEGRGLDRQHQAWPGGRVPTETSPKEEASWARGK